MRGWPLAKVKRGCCAGAEVGAPPARYRAIAAYGQSGPPTRGMCTVLPSKNWSVLEWRSLKAKWVGAQHRSARVAWSLGSKRHGEGAVNSLMQNRPKKAKVNAATSMCLSLRGREWNRARAARRSASTWLVMDRRVVEAGATRVRLIPRFGQLQQRVMPCGVGEACLAVQGGHDCQVDCDGAWGEGAAECCGKIRHR